MVIRGRKLNPIRRCQECKKHKPLKEFGKAPSKPGGRTYVCLPCERKRQLRMRFKGMTDNDIKTEVLKSYRLYLQKLEMAREILEERKDS